MLLIERTLEVIDSVAKSMESVISTFEARRGSARVMLSFATEINNIDSLEKETDDCLKSSQTYALENWNSIIQNDIWLSRIQEYFRKCLEFRATIARFDDLVYSGDDYEGILGEDNMIARRYLVMSEKWYQASTKMIETVGLGEDGREDQEKKKCIIARWFHAFFVGVSDADLKAFIVSRVPLPHRPKWLMEKRQAVVFGKMLGLSCSDMNKSFLFTGRDGKPTKLNYGHNAPTLHFSNYSIYPLIEKLKAKLRMEK